jgi:hypothetical protein
MPEKLEQAHADHTTAVLVAPELSVSENQLPPAITPALAESQQPVERRNSLMPNAVVLPLNTVLRNVAAPVSNWREFKPASISIEPRAGLEFEFEMSSVRTEHDRTIWTGENPDLPGAFLVSVATETDWQAVLSYGSPVKGTFRIQASGDKAAVSELSGDISCGVPGHAAAGDFAALGDDTLAGNLNPDGDMSAAMAAAGGVYTVDVLFFYDHDTVIFNTPAKVKSWMIADIESANQILQYSLINTFRWHFVECYEVPQYARPAGLEGDINLMRDQSTQVGGFIELKRKQHHADQCQLWVNSSRGDGYAGMAEVLGVYSVVLSDYGYMTVTHELGHNFGCQHDRLESSSGAQDDDRKYNYGWSIKEKDPEDESKELYFGTVMSYATTSRYNYFSNPNLYVYEFMTSSTYFIGVPTNEPQAAYNALVMRGNGPWMSIVGDAPAPPSILAQPQSVTMSVGSSATLRVYVSSPVKAGNVRYQWRKGMSALTGATSDSLVILANSINDNGIYYVDITNDSEYVVTSNPAMVTVTTMPVPTTYSDTSGGGAPSLWYLSGICLSFAAWLFRRKK